MKRLVPIPKEYADIPLSQIWIPKTVLKALVPIAATNLGHINRIANSTGWDEGLADQVAVLVKALATGRFSTKRDKTTSQAIRFIVSHVASCITNTTLSAGDRDIMERRAAGETLQNIGASRGRTREWVRLRQDYLLAWIRKSAGQRMFYAVDLLRTDCEKRSSFIFISDIEEARASLVCIPPRSAQFYAAVIRMLFPDLPVWVSLRQVRRHSDERGRRILRLARHVLRSEGPVMPTVRVFALAKQNMPDLGQVEFRNTVTSCRRIAVTDKSMSASGMSR